MIFWWGNIYKNQKIEAQSIFFDFNNIMAKKYGQLKFLLMMNSELFCTQVKSYQTKPAIDNFS